MKLYYSPGACSLSPHIVLREAGVPFSLERVDLRVMPHRVVSDGRDFAEVNPKNYIPALEFADGRMLTEGPAIVQYVADLVPEKQLAPPAGSFERYRLQEWLTFIGTELHKTIGSLFRPAPDEVRQAMIARAMSRYDWIEPQLAAREYLMGDRFSVADAYLFTVTNWCAMHKLSLDAYPGLRAFQARMAARPAVQEAMRAEGLLGQ